jgi:type I restriction enzyme R subunit
VVLLTCLREAIHKPNPAIPTAAREDAQQVLDLGIPCAAVGQPPFPPPAGGWCAAVPKTDLVVTLCLVANPERNEWLVVNQFSIKGSAPIPRRPDIILFVNGRHWC